MTVRTLLLASLTVVAVSTGGVAGGPPARPYWRTIVRGTHGMVAAEHPLEAMAGFEALKAGGNAIDAALAIFYMTTRGGAASIRPRRRLLRAGLHRQGEARSVLQRHGPGAQAGDARDISQAGRHTGQRAVRRFRAGRGRRDSIWPGRNMAASTTPRCSSRRSQRLLKAMRLSEWSATEFRGSLLRAFEISELGAGASCRAASRRSPETCFASRISPRPFKRSRAKAADVFYRGSLAHMTADTYQKAGGVLRYEDLAGFHAEQSEPIHTNYKGYEVYESAPEFARHRAADGAEYCGRAGSEIDGPQLARLRARR